ncbi:MAG TPA: hypothetical protein VNX29_01875 [Kaistia sp.]|nr:hypothetical protein [Kaistia sp.]
MADDPIEALQFTSGVTVVDIGDLRVARGLTRRPVSSCSHRNMTYDPKERRIWCRDCEKDVDSFDGFRILVEQYSGALNTLKAREGRLIEAEQFKARSLAAKVMDEAWRSRTMVPMCPSCSAGLFPEDFKNGIGMVSREFAAARRKKSGDRADG